jgi:DnaJ-class molecular chaperone
VQCDECAGTGKIKKNIVKTVDCVQCRGKGRIALRCTDCQGTGLVKCQNIGKGYEGVIIPGLDTRDYKDHVEK